MKRIIIFIFLLATFVATTYSQDDNNADSAHQLACYMPPGVLAYAEVDDLNAKIGSVLDAPWKESFVKSKAYKDFTVSKLYNKIADRIQALEEATDFGLSLDNFRALAGGRSALALYDIGDLRFLFISEMALEQVAASALWNLRERFEQRGEGDDRYWVKEDPYGRVSLAFTFVGGRLLAGTDVLRFEQARELLRADGENLSGDERFTAALPPDPAGGQIFVFLDQERLAATPYWRSYWLFGNQKELADIHSVVLMLDLSDEEIRETRWLRRDLLPGTAAKFDAIAAGMPADAIYHEYGVADDNKLKYLLGELLGGALEKEISSLAAPFQQGLSRSYGVAIDIADSNGKLGARINKIIAFELGDATIFDAAGFESAIADFFGKRLLPQGQAKFGFVDKDGIRVLELPLFEAEAPAYRVAGSTVFISNTVAAFSSSSDNNAQREILAAQTGVATATWLKADSAKGKLKELLLLLGGKSGWRPQANAGFFSENMVSLLSLLEGIESMNMIRRVENDAVQEIVNYRMTR